MALRALHYVKEEGEISKELAIAEMKVDFKAGFKDKIKKETILSLLHSPVYYHKILHKKLKNSMGHRVVSRRKWRHTA
jgi:hypothetical protein